MFSEDGTWLFTTENDYRAGRGCVGVWDASRGYVRVAEFASGGTGPHDIKRLPCTQVLVIANGGIDTHPETGRTKLNIPTMRPNLAYIAGGVVTRTARLPDDMHKASIRHLAVAADGTVAFGMQWQGSGPAPALVGTHAPGRDITLMQGSAGRGSAGRGGDMHGYVGSIDMTPDGRSVAVTSPRGGLVQVYDTRTGRMTGDLRQIDVCGIAAQGGGFVMTAGTGDIRRSPSPSSPARPGGGAAAPGASYDLRLDNHLIAIGRIQARVRRFRS